MSIFDRLSGTTTSEDKSDLGSPRIIKPSPIQSALIQFGGHFSHVILKKESRKKEQKDNNSYIHITHELISIIKIYDLINL